MGAPSRPSMYLDRMIPAKEALSRVRNGKTIFVGSGAGEPRLLVNTLAEMANKYWDVQVIHLAATDKEFVLARPEYKNHFHYKIHIIAPFFLRHLKEPFSFLLQVLFYLSIS